MRWFKLANLEVGEKYLNIQILGSVKCAAFKNKDKKKPTDPDYIGNGVVVWVSQKKAPNTNARVTQEDI